MQSFLVVCSTYRSGGIECMNIKLSIVLRGCPPEYGVIDGAICPEQFFGATNNSPFTICIGDPHD